MMPISHQYLWSSMDTLMEKYPSFTKVDKKEQMTLMKVDMSSVTFNSPFLCNFLLMLPYLQIIVFLVSEHDVNRYFSIAP